MKKPIYSSLSNKELEKFRKENKKIKEEYDRYKESVSEKLKDLDLLIIQNEKIKKENEELKKKISKLTNNTNNQCEIIKHKESLKVESIKEQQISLLIKQRDYLLSIFNKLNSKIKKEFILSQLDEKYIDKEKTKEKLTNNIINLIYEGRKSIEKNFKIIKNSFEFIKNSKDANSSMNSFNSKSEADLIRRINDMLSIIRRKKEILKTKKNNTTYRAGINDKK